MRAYIIKNYIIWAYIIVVPDDCLKFESRIFYGADAFMKDGRQALSF